MNIIFCGFSVIGFDFWMQTRVWMWLSSFTVSNIDKTFSNYLFLERQIIVIFQTLIEFFPIRRVVLMYTSTIFHKRLKGLLNSQHERKNNWKPETWLNPGLHWHWQHLYRAMTASFIHPRIPWQLHSYNKSFGIYQVLKINRRTKNLQVELRLHRRCLP